MLVFAAGGQAVTLPDGATPVDLAYALGGTVGHRTIGARVNGGLVPLTIPLAEGDRVEILTSESENPGPVAGLADLGPDAERAGPDPAVVHRAEPGRGDRARPARAGGGLRGRRRVSLEVAVEDGSLLVTALERGHRQLDELYAAVAERRVVADQVVVRCRDHAS